VALAETIPSAGSGNSIDQSATPLWVLAGSKGTGVYDVIVVSGQRDNMRHGATDLRFSFEKRRIQPPRRRAFAMSDLRFAIAIRSSHFLLLDCPSNATVHAALSREERLDHRFQGKTAGFDATHGCDCAGIYRRESHEFNSLDVS
jgi:hypothetical protein